MCLNDTTATKRCTKCKQEKPITEFPPNKRNRSGLRSRCKRCTADYAREWRKANPERVLESARKWRKANPEHVAEYFRAYYKANRDRRDAHTRGYKARKRGAEGNHTAEDIALQYKRQHGRCYYCHEKVGNTYDIDHVVPLSRGGSNAPDNLVIACPACNRAKNDRLPHEWPEGGRLL